MRTRGLSPHLFLATVLIAFLVGLIFAPPDFSVHASGGVWTTFGDTNDIRALAFEGSFSLWAATSGGVVRWDLTTDPPTYTVFTIDHGLPSNLVFSVAVDQVGVKWFGTDRGLARFDDSTWQTFTPRDGLGFTQIEVVAVDQAGQIWASSSGGGRTTVLVNGTWRIYASIDEAIQAHYSVLKGSRSSLLWTIELPDKIWTTIGAQAGARVYNGSQWTSYESLGFVDATLVDGQSVKWFGTDVGVKSLKEASLTTYTTDNTGNGLVPGVVKTAVIDKAGTRWFGASSCTMMGCTGGISSLTADGSTWTPYTANNGFVSHDVRAMVVDGLDRKWVATDHGLARFDGHQWTTFYTQAPPGSNITALAVDSAGRVWVGSDIAGIGMFDGTRWTLYNRGTDPGLLSDAIHALAVGPDQRVWSATGDMIGGTVHGGVSTWSNTSWIQQPPTGGYFQALAIEPTSGIVWAGSGSAPGSSGRLWRYDGQAWMEFVPGTGPIPYFTSVNGIAIDPSGNKWVATDAGLVKLGNSGFDQWAVYTAQDGLLSDNVLSVAAGRDGRIWAGTFQGLSVYDPSSIPHWSSYTTASGLPGNSVWALAVDPAGRVWIGTGDRDPSSTRGGLSVFDGTQWRTFTINDGLPVNNVQTIALAANGEVWLGTWAGGLSRRRTGCPADVVANGVVNAADLQTVVGDWRAGPLRYDLTGDGRFNIADIELAASLWGFPCP